MSYQQWIEKWIAEQKWIAGRCGFATQEMKKVFPELRIVAGWVFHSAGSDEHFWCVAPDGRIVDPTASQFRGITGYQEWKPGDEVCVGKCMNCGIRIFRAVDVLDGRRETSCGKDCEDELRREYA